MKSFCIAALAAVCVFFAGCATTGSTQTPAQVAATICPALQSEVSLLSASGVFTGGAQATLVNQVTPDVASVCAAGVTVTSISLQNLVNATLPVIVSAINASPMLAAQKNEAILAIGAFSMAINTALSLQAAPLSTTMPPAAVSMPASALLVAAK